MNTKKKVLLSIGVILGIAILVIIIAFVAIFARGPRDYNEDGSILKVKNLNEVRTILGDEAIYLSDDFLNSYANISEKPSYGVHFEGNLNNGELNKIPIKRNDKADGYRVFFDKPNNIKVNGIVFLELNIDYLRHPNVQDTASNNYSKSSDIHRASQGNGFSYVKVFIEDKYGTLEFYAQLDVQDSVSEAEFDDVTNMLIEEYENAII